MLGTGADGGGAHMGWRRLLGSPKLQIIFHKRATKYRSLLQKMTYKDKGSYASSPPCISKSYFLHTSCVCCGVLQQFFDIECAYSSLECCSVLQSVAVCFSVLQWC